MWDFSECVIVIVIVIPRAARQEPLSERISAHRRYTRPVGHSSEQCVVDKTGFFSSTSHGEDEKIPENHAGNRGRRTASKT